MLTTNGRGTQRLKSGKAGTAPCLKIASLGIVSRDYSHKYENGFRDFSHVMPEVLKLLDNRKCDAVLFSLYSLIPRSEFVVQDVLNELKLEDIKSVFIEEYQDGGAREAKRFVVYHKSQGWRAYEFAQKFGTVTGMRRADIQDFVKNEMPKRILGDCSVLLCGETNGVKYSPKDKEVKDAFGVRAAIPHANIVLNPIHDRMTRFEMKLKRKFLSEPDRWVVSVWNKGKKDKNGSVRDGKSPAWTVYHNGQEILVPPITTDFPKIEIGILDISKGHNRALNAVAAR